MGLLLKGNKLSVISIEQPSLDALAANPDFDMVLMNCMMPVQIENLLIQMAQWMPEKK